MENLFIHKSSVVLRYIKKQKKNAKSQTFEIAQMVMRMWPRLNLTTFNHQMISDREHIFYRQRTNEFFCNQFNQCLSEKCYKCIEYY